MNGHLQPVVDWNTPPRTPEAWSAILGSFLQAFACKTGTIHRIDPESGMLVMISHIGIPAGLMDKVACIPVGKGIAGAAAERREAVQFCNIQDDPTGVVRPNARLTNVQGAIAVPVLLEGRLVGVLGVGKMEPHDFTPEESAAILAAGAKLGPWLA